MYLPYSKAASILARESLPKVNFWRLDLFSGGRPSWGSASLKKINLTDDIVSVDSSFHVIGVVTRKVANTNVLGL